MSPPLQDSSVGPALSRCNSKRLRPSEEQDPDLASSSRVPHDIQEQLADTVLTQMTIFQECLISAFEQNRHEDRTTIEHGYSRIAAEVTQAQREHQNRHYWQNQLWAR